MKYEIFLSPLFVYSTFLATRFIIRNFAIVKPMKTITMRSKMNFYLLVASIMISGIFPISVWAGVNESSCSSNEKVSAKIDIPLTYRKGKKQRSVIVPPCSVKLSESELIFQFYSLSEDAEIILYNAEDEILRVTISSSQRNSEMNIPIQFLESGNYLLEFITLSGETWSGNFIK